MTLSVGHAAWAIMRRVIIAEPAYIIDQCTSLRSCHLDTYISSGQYSARIHSGSLWLAEECVIKVYFIYFEIEIWYSLCQ
jgi:hypothetical protein